MSATPAETILSIPLNEWVQLEDSLRMKWVSRNLSSTSFAPKGSEVYLHSEGRQGDTVIDSTHSRGCPMHFTLGENHVAPMYETICKYLHEEDQVVVECPAYLGIVKSKWPRGLRKRDRMVYEIQMVKWETLHSITYDDSIKKEYVKRGTGTETPSEGNRVTFTYKIDIQLTSSSEYENVSSDTTTKVLGRDHVCQGIEQSLNSMGKDEHAIFSISPILFIGTTLMSSYDWKKYHMIRVTLHLVDFTVPKRKWEWNVEEKLEFATYRKQQGSMYFGENLPERAQYRYDQALNWLRYESEQLPVEMKTAYDALKATCYCNLAVIKTSAQEYGQVIDLCSKVLALEPTSKKAYYHRIKAWIATRHPEKAMEDVKRARSVVSKAEMEQFQVLERIARGIIEKGGRKEKRQFGGWCDRSNLLNDARVEETESTTTSQVSKETLLGSILERLEHVPLEPGQEEEQITIESLKQKAREKLGLTDEKQVTLSLEQLKELAYHQNEKERETS